MAKYRPSTLKLGERGKSVIRRQSFLWITFILFACSFGGQLITHHGSGVEFWNAVFENWQSEFLQLMWQVGGLILFLAWTSTQSQENDERLETKIDEILTRGCGMSEEELADIDQLLGRK